MCYSGKTHLKSEKDRLGVQGLVSNIQAGNLQEAICNVLFKECPKEDVVEMHDQKKNQKQLDRERKALECLKEKNIVQHCKQEIEQYEELVRHKNRRWKEKAKREDEKRKKKKTKKGRRRRRRDLFPGCGLRTHFFCMRSGHSSSLPGYFRRAVVVEFFLFCTFDIHAFFKIMALPSRQEPGLNSRGYEKSP